MDHLSSTEIVAFGKLPWAADFLSTGTSDQAEPFLHWLEQGIVQGGSRGEPWKEAFDGGAQKGFLFRVSPQLVLAGVIAPSRDAVGRRFPFSLYCSLPLASVVRDGHALPLSLGSFLHTCGAQIEHLAEQRLDLSTHLRSMSGPDLSALHAHEEGYLGWTREAPLRVAGQAIFGANWRDALAHALYIAIESTRATFGQSDTKSALAIRFPVGSGLAGAAALWLHVMRLCGGWEKALPTTVWSFDPYGASVTIFVGQVSGAGFADLWERAPRNDWLSDLVEAPSTSAPYLAQIRPDLAQVVYSETAVVADMLGTLAFRG
jgi:type VI secretion system ImpM family protein